MGEEKVSRWAVPSVLVGGEGVSSVFSLPLVTLLHSSKGTDTVMEAQGSELGLLGCANGRYLSV